MKKEKKKGKSSYRKILNSIKVKVIIGFIIFSLAVLFSRLVVRYTFNEMIIAIDKISAPNYKMALINEMFRDIAELEQTQREKSISSPNLSENKLLSGSENLRKKLDTLSLLVHENQTQMARIDSMKIILSEHDRLYKRYLNIKIQTSKADLLGQKINELSKLVPDGKRKESSVVKTEKKVTTTTFYPEKPVEEKETFFERLFNLNNDKEPKVPEPDRIVRKEEDIKIDTVEQFRTDTLIGRAITMMDELKQDQKLKNLQLTRQEIALLNSSGRLIRNLMQLSHEIQQAEAQKERLTTQLRSQKILENLKKYSLFIFAFFILSGLVVFLIFLDISKSNYFRTRLEQAKSKAEHLSMVKQRFLANMSHEIRTPLQSIIGFSEQLINQPGITEKASKAIHKSSQHLLHLVNEVLDYSKLESNTFKLNNQPFNLKKVMTEVVEIASEKCEKNNLTFQYTINFKNIDKLYLGDAFRLKQILFNLLDNAIKYTEKGTVSLQVFEEPNEFETSFSIYVKDTGIGISAEDRIKIFNEFEQVNHQSPQRGGIGLGLGIVKEIVNAKGGTIDLESQPGDGSTFIVKLTYKHTQNVVIKKENNLTQHIKENHKTNHVMVIDDDEFILDMYEIIFSKRGISFQLFTSGDDLLKSEISEIMPGTTMLIDYHLPNGQTGDRLTEEIRSLFPSEIYFIAVTAYAPKDEVYNKLTESFDDILYKPFTENDLLDVLNILELDQDQNTTSETDVPNMSNLYKIAGNDPDLIHAFVKDFTRESKRDIKLLKTAISINERPTIVNILHRIGGRCGHLGSFELSLEFRRLQMLVKGSKTNSGAELIQAIDEAIIRLKNLLDQLTKPNTNPCNQLRYE